ncbi:thioredoxin-like domain-containing protein [uncultured Tenacibaculum sp.]|uniref:TlpA family protein disulfide reductase n=1 Tax=uncultured Tenacibaculum sp. TaxID=174713 RepID=UPI002618D8CA|nr:thioredoxin-like domain-containing protein [uncultured Tenacibaculum sp.]
MRNIIALLLISSFVSCGVFQPKQFSQEALEEELLTVDRKETSLKEILAKNQEQKKFIQIYASYCPISQDSFDDVVKFQNKNTDAEYIFLSVDHSYHDWKRGLESLKVKGSHYYIQKKGKGVLGEFLKLKTIPRFLIIDKEGNILVYKTSKLSETLQQKIK